MEALLDDRGPGVCSPLGLDCHSCIERSAATVATICRGMTAEGVEKIFFQMYPSKGCAPMTMAFESAYFAASVPRKSMVRAIAAA